MTEVVALGATRIVRYVVSRDTFDYWMVWDTVTQCVVASMPERSSAERYAALLGVGD